ncbi:hypothetical protein [Anaerolentibacter hominis]|uniref:hypothetical protein n=1 Tax=Anaerolentibacter hominis TaxID=3079009 RepID=UPI0031B84B61
MDKKISKINEDSMYDIDINACSATDCTGVVPAAPASEAEMESYLEVYDFLPTTVRKKSKDSQPKI